MKKDTPGILAPPPLIFAAFFFLGWWGRNLLPRWGSVHIGAVLTLLCAIVFVWGLVSLERKKTSIDPYTPTRAIVTNGPYRISRNPLYVSMVLGYLGAAVWTAAPATLVLLPVALLVLHYGVIAREERYLEAKFGDEYREYKRRVRRWL